MAISQRPNPANITMGRTRKPPFPGAMGISKNADKFVPQLTVRVPIVPAQLRNDAGIIGAAIVAAEAAGVAGAAAAAPEAGRIIDGPQIPLPPRSSERLP